MVGVNDELTGQAVNAFVALKDGFDHTDQIKKDLILQVRKSIGPFAAPKAVYTVPDLPKTRSGKIMRRILRKILAGEEDQLGDTSTVSSPFSLPLLRDILPRRNAPYYFHGGDSISRLHPAWLESDRLGLSRASPCFSRQ